MNPHAYLQQISGKRPTLSGRDAIVTLLDEVEYLYDALDPEWQDAAVGLGQPERRRPLRARPLCGLVGAGRPGALSAFPAGRCRCDQPVALLASATRLPESRVVAPWRALPEDAEARLLEADVAGLRGSSLWFERAADGSGMKLGAGATAALPPDAFPERLLAVEAFPAEPGERLEAYLHRRAARLLMLPLSPSCRSATESAAAAQGAGV